MSQGTRHRARQDRTPSPRGGGPPCHPHSGAASGRGTFRYGPSKGGSTAPIADGDTEAAGGPADKAQKHDRLRAGPSLPRGTPPPTTLQGPRARGEDRSAGGSDGAWGRHVQQGQPFGLGDKKARWMGACDDCTAARTSLMPCTARVTCEDSRLYAPYFPAVTEDGGLAVLRPSQTAAPRGPCAQGQSLCHVPSSTCSPRVCHFWVILAIVPICHYRTDYGDV